MSNSIFKDGIFTGLLAKDRETHEKLCKEAESVGLDLVSFSDSGDSRYRVYKFANCGHSAELAVVNVRNNNFTCKSCLENNLANDANAAGIEMLGASTLSKCYRKYKLSCGHTQDICTPDVRRRNFRCRTCLSEKVEKDAEIAGLKIVGSSSKGCLYRRYILPCGHEQDITVNNVRISSFGCKECLRQKHEDEARAVALALVGASDVGGCYREYKLPCGHYADLQLSNVRSGSFACPVCGDHSWNQPSNTYVYLLSLGDFKWLKVGYAKSIDSRVSRYGLVKGSRTELLYSKKHATGKDAFREESEIISEIKRFNLCSEYMKKYMPVSGFTECFTIDALPIIEKFFKKI